MIQKQNDMIEDSVINPILYDIEQNLIACMNILIETKNEE